MLLFMLSACEPEVNEKPDETYDPSMFQSGVCAFDSTDTLAPRFPENIGTTETFPALACHVIWREWLFQDTVGFVDGYKPWRDYLDFRLNQLYPLTAYPGIVNDARAEYEDFLDSFGAWEACYYAWEDFWGTPSDTIDGPPEPYVDPQGEFDLLDMSTDEIEKFERYDSVVFADTVVSSTLMDSIVHQYGSFKNGHHILFIPLGGMVGGLPGIVLGYAAHRTFIAKEKVEKTAVDLFDDDPLNFLKGPRKDAWKHIFASAYLRKNFTRPWAALAGWAREAFKPGNQPRDKWMDYHNNAIGRVRKYKDFKDSDVDIMAENVFDWINETINTTCSGYNPYLENAVCPMPDWGNNPPSNREARRFARNSNKIDRDEYFIYEN